MLSRNTNTTFKKSKRQRNQAWRGNVNSMYKSAIQSLPQSHESKVNGETIRDNSLDDMESSSSSSEEEQSDRHYNYFHDQVPSGNPVFVEYGDNSHQPQVTGGFPIPHGNHHQFSNPILSGTDESSSSSISSNYKNGPGFAMDLDQGEPKSSSSSEEPMTQDDEAWTKDVVRERQEMEALISTDDEMNSDLGIGGGFDPSGAYDAPTNWWVNVEPQKYLHYQNKPSHHHKPVSSYE